MDSGIYKKFDLKNIIFFTLPYIICLTKFEVCRKKAIVENKKVNKRINKSCHFRLLFKQGYAEIQKVNKRVNKSFHFRLPFKLQPRTKYLRKTLVFL